jgi:hypothetical protein
MAADSPQPQTYSSPPLTNSPDASPSVSQALAALSATPEPHAGRHLALLITSMYLVTRPRITKGVERPMFDDLYRLVKRIIALAFVEKTVPSVQLVQCAALLAMYEYGHGDSVMAYRTLSEGVAAARIIGVQPGRINEGQNALINGLSSVEREQNSNLWWSLFLLDQ